MGRANQRGGLPWTIERIWDEHATLIRSAVVDAKVAPADRDDAVQEVLLSIERSLPSFDPERGASIEAWLYGAALRSAGRFAKDWRQKTQHERYDEEAVRALDTA